MMLMRRRMPVGDCSRIILLFGWIFGWVAPASLLRGSPTNEQLALSSNTTAAFSASSLQPKPKPAATAQHLPPQQVEEENFHHTNDTELLQTSSSLLLCHPAATSNINNNNNNSNNNVTTTTQLQDGIAWQCQVHIAVAGLYQWEYRVQTSTSTTTTTTTTRPGWIQVRVEEPVATSHHDSSSPRYRMVQHTLTTTRVNSKQRDDDDVDDDDANKWQTISPSTPVMILDDDDDNNSISSSASISSQPQLMSLTAGWHRVEWTVLQTGCLQTLQWVQLVLVEQQQQQQHQQQHDDNHNNSIRNVKDDNDNSTNNNIQDHGVPVPVHVPPPTTIPRQTQRKTLLLRKHHKANDDNSQQTHSAATGFVRAHGTDLIDPVGEPLLLRGMGLGGWMLQEPYMMDHPTAVAQWQMLEQVAALVGPRNADRYRQAWLDHWMRHTDVQELRRSGFNAIRLPLHYNVLTKSIQDEDLVGHDTWLEDGFRRIDQLLEWCQQEEIYLILDLHAAPGGQGRDAKISDYNPAWPSLWEDAENVRKAVALWAQLAERYADEAWVAGYDLLNEPNWDFESQTLAHDNDNNDEGGCTNTENAPLLDFYEQTIAAIRAVDQNHALFVQGNCWANNHAGLWPQLKEADETDNLVLSFHRYWVTNGHATIQEFVDLRETYQVPLWMGESGENHNFWYHQAILLLERHNIGWAWWTWKKMQSTSGAYAIYPPDEYYDLIEYWEITSAGNNDNDSNSISKPRRTVAYRTLMQVAQSARLEESHRNEATIQALTGYIRSCDDVGYTQLSSSSSAVRVQAEDFCRMLGIATEETTDDGGGQNVGWFDQPAWTRYKVRVPQAATYRIRYRVASLDGDGAFQIELSQQNNDSEDNDNSAIIGKMADLPKTGSWQAWTTIEGTVELPQGTHTIVIRSTSAGWNLNWFELEPIV